MKNETSLRSGVARRNGAREIEHIGNQRQNRRLLAGHTIGITLHHPVLSMLFKDHQSVARPIPSSRGLAILAKSNRMREPVFAAGSRFILRFNRAELSARLGGWVGCKNSLSVLTQNLRMTGCAP